MFYHQSFETLKLSIFLYNLVCYIGVLLKLYFTGCMAYIPEIVLLANLFCEAMAVIESVQRPANNDTLQEPQQPGY